ncbi:MAG TPA: hypothetical protein VGJ91_05085 [Polyangiaceae bacterium]|jgi:hypothetical protein
MSLRTPRLITRTTVKAAVVTLVTTVTEVFEVDAEHVDELPPSVPAFRKAEPLVTLPVLRVAGRR